ncbi:outer membrane beta-barrel protein [Lewinella sp. 4G2]|uniref:outer membrane beta-barrel protein n=1 Tax=Lewinella sp. 4G2 TaxID=1803372 RepID=UPI0012F8F7F8|nr:outer membrane beta-barrel protein [Lewinella sp. 4G2]
MRFCLLLLLAVSFVPASICAQEELRPIIKNEVSLTIGLHRGHFNDANYSPLHQTSTGPRVGLAYRRNTRSGDRYELGLGATLAKLRSSVTDDTPASRYLLDLQVGYLKGLGTNNEDRRVHVGINYRSYVDISIYDDAEAVTWFGLHAFEGAAAGAWELGKQHGLKASIAVPFYGLLSRPPYSGWDKFVVENEDNIPKIITRGRWTSLNDFFGIRGGLGYRYALNDRWVFDANYQVSYYATQQLDRYRSINNAFSVSTTHRF